MGRDAARRFPWLRVDVVEVDQQPHPDLVVAVPTYVLNDAIISLGNPHEAELFSLLERVR